jgi:hypothetical protein
VGALVPLTQSTRAAPAVGVPEAEALAEANLYAVCELIAGRAARPSTRRQYAGIFRRFCDALRAELGRPPPSPT